LKCNDFREQIKSIVIDEQFNLNLKGVKRRTFHEIVRLDIEFLIRAEIIDYSLLVGEIIDVDYKTLRS